ncbi:MAG: cadherin domain-containing protein [Chitinophagaceae bacterium]
MKLKLTCLICCFLAVSGLHAQTIPLFKETFDNIPGPTNGGAGTYAFPVGWTFADVSGLANAWRRVPQYGLNGDLTHENDTCAVAYTPGRVGYNSDNWMWTPGIALSGSNIQLSWIARTSVEQLPAVRAIYQVRIMTVPPGDIYSSAILLPSTSENFAWTSSTLDLSAYRGQKVYIGFRNLSDGGKLLMVDNVTVKTNFAITSSDTTTIFSNAVTFSRPENTTTVTTVTATNEAGGSLSYSITGGADAGKFSINSTTGVLSFLTAPDFEAPGDAGTDNVYEVTVQATNGTLTDVQQVKVTVTDAAEIAITSYNGAASATVNVAENQTAVTRMTATTILSQAIAYRLAGSDDDSYFTVNSATGQLSFRNAPDFERPSDPDENNLYMVTVEASASGLTALQRFKVRVTNVNDNAPEFGSFDGDAAVTLKLPENTTTVGTVWAVDKEPGTTITYSIPAGNEGALFSIDATTGVLRFITAPDYENPADQYAGNAYIVTVQASDGQLSSLQRFKIKITDVNESTARMSSNTKTMTAAVGETEPDNKGISVFPNPVTGKRFTLRANGLAEGKYLVELYTAAGQLAYRYPLNHPGKSMSYPIQLPASILKGMYVLKLAGTGVMHTEKLLIE